MPSAIRAGVLLAALVAAPAAAQEEHAFPELGVTYRIAQGWSLAKEDRAVHVFTDAAQKSWLLVYAGTYADADAATAPGREVALQLAEAEQVEVVDSAKSHRMLRAERSTEWGAKVKGRSGRKLRLRVVVMPTGYERMWIGGILVSGGTGDLFYKGMLYDVVGSVQAGPPQPRGVAGGGGNGNGNIVGKWVWSNGYSSGYGGGGSNSMKVWTFHANGRAEYYYNSSTYMPGAVIEPTERNDAGSWQLQGNRLTVTLRNGGRSTYRVGWNGQRLVLDDQEFRPDR